MNLQLAESIGTYFVACNGTDTTRITDCFTQDALVFDEGNTHWGHGVIQSWLQEARKKFEYYIEPISTFQEGEYLTVVAKVTGNFPSSPIQLRHSFQLRSGKIQSLEIN
ncbi:nuclear transport factor 2 family protein [Nostoc sp.]|uniref:nuclear transport factor 2 family protein n=1 Tax=Nostoc sp. TaxID=1180 RepID=UPI002FF80710